MDYGKYQGTHTYPPHTFPPFLPLSPSLRTDLMLRPVTGRPPGRHFKKGLAEITRACDGDRQKQIERVKDWTRACKKERLSSPSQTLHLWQVTVLAAFMSYLIYRPLFSRSHMDLYIEKNSCLSVFSSLYLLQIQTFNSDSIHVCKDFIRSAHISLYRHVILYPIVSTKQRLWGEVTQTQSAECSASLIPGVVLAMTSNSSSYATSKFGKRTLNFISYFLEWVRNKPTQL